MDQKAAFNSRLSSGLWLGLMLLTLSVPAWSGEASPTLTTIAHYWALSEPERRHSLQVNMEFAINYYDPLWSLLWAEQNGESYFLPVRGRALPMRSGQRVRLEGPLAPSDGFSTEHLKVTILGDNQWPGPIEIAGKLNDITAFDTKRVVLEGYVFSQKEVGPTHVNLQVFSEGRMVNVNLMIGDNSPIPQLNEAYVRLIGVGIAVRDSSGQTPRIDLWVPRLADVSVKSWLAEDPGFKLSPTPIGQLGSQGGDQPVKIAGVVYAQVPGVSITIQDATGLVVLTTEQPGLFPSGASVEAIGRPEEKRGVWTLRNALFRRTGQADSPAIAGNEGNVIPTLKLRLADQVLALTAANGERSQPVALRGVVTWSDERESFFYLQDVSGGVRINNLEAAAGIPVVGSSLSITGTTVDGLYAPAVTLHESTVLGLLVLPPARAISLEQARTGVYEGRRVEMRGYVYAMEQEQGHTILRLAAPTGNYQVQVPDDPKLKALNGAVVRVSGVCTALANANRELIGIRLLSPDTDAITVEASVADPFSSTPWQSVASLRQFAGQQAFTRLVRLTGTVLFQQPGQYLYLQDETGGLQILSRSTQIWPPGSRIEVVGFPGRERDRVVLREAQIRPGTAGPALEPRFLEDPGKVDPLNDGRLVRVKAVLRQVVDEGTHARLILQVDQETLDARLPARGDWSPPALRSVLQVTGVCLVEYDEYHQPRRFSLELRTPDDLALLEAPPWWNVRRAIGLAGGLALCSLLIMAWVVSLRRQVRTQTELMRLQAAKEARLQAELERSFRLESLGFLAIGIVHDFNSLLTTILGNLSLARMDKRVMAAAGDCIHEAERAARKAREATLRLQTFAKGDDPVCTPVLLPDLVAEAANFARHDTNIRLDFQYPAILPPGHIDAGQISRVVHNLVLNAVQNMPEGGVVSITMAAVAVKEAEIATLVPGPYILLTIADSGKGIAPEALARVFDPYHAPEGMQGSMGLATVRAILKKHQGHIEVDSLPGQGTCFRLWLPVADDKAMTIAVRQSAGDPARILFMDHDRPVLHSISRLLGLAGHEVVCITEQEELVPTYAAARELGRPFDLVFLEWTTTGRPGVTGALADLRKLDPDVRAVACTENADGGGLPQNQADSFYAVVPKPYDIHGLLKIIGFLRTTS